MVESRFEDAWKRPDWRPATETEAAFHARLNAARHEMETNPNPYERRAAADEISRLTCHDVSARRFPDDHLWLGDWQARRTPELDKYMKRCRRLWREQVVNAQA
jgi:hypothetical protein